MSKSEIPNAFQGKKHDCQCRHNQKLDRMVHTVGQQTVFPKIPQDLQLRSLETIHNSTEPQVLYWKQTE